MTEAKSQIDKITLQTAFRHMATAKSMTEVFEENFKFVSKYVHATSRGHEAPQIALGLQLLPQDWVAPYYRDDSILLATWESASRVQQSRTTVAAPAPVAAAA